MGFYLMRVPLLLAATAAWDAWSPSPQNLKVLLCLPVLVVFAIDLSLYGDRLVLAGPTAAMLSNLFWPMYERLAVYLAFVAIALALSGMARWGPAFLKSRWRGLPARSTLLTTALIAGLLVDVFQYSHQSGLPTNKFRRTYRDEPTIHWGLADKTSATYQAGRIEPLKWQPERLGAPDDARQRIVLESPMHFQTYAYAQFDPCQSSLDVRVMATSIRRLLALRDTGDKQLQTILGCGAPKLRLATAAIYVNNESEAAAVVQSRPDLAAVAVLQFPSNIPPPAERSSATRADFGTVTVISFGANALTARISVNDSDGAWLIYADAYDPRWRAWVDEKPVPIVPAYVGLKAVRVPAGESVVRMEFRGRTAVGMRMLAVAGAICSLLLLVYCAVCCVAGFPSSQRRTESSRAERPEKVLV